MQPYINLCRIISATGAITDTHSRVEGGRKGLRLDRTVFTRAQRWEITRQILSSSSIKREVVSEAGATFPVSTLLFELRRAVEAWADQRLAL